MTISENVNLAERLQRGSAEYQDTMKSHHQFDVYLKTEGGHANQWGNLQISNETGNTP